MPPTLRVGISINEYLAMQFEQECELIAGELRPKPMGTREHSRMQGRLYVRLLNQFGELRTGLQFSVRNVEDVLIPDICIAADDNPALYRDVLDEAPLFCVEIVSPSQRPGELFVKCEMYHEWGVEFCWVVDPVVKRAWNYHAGMHAAAEIFDALSGPMTLPLSEIF